MFWWIDLGRGRLKTSIKSYLIPSDSSVVTKSQNILSSFKASIVGDGTENLTFNCLTQFHLDQRRSIKATWSEEASWR